MQEAGVALQQLQSLGENSGPVLKVRVCMYMFVHVCIDHPVHHVVHKHVPWYKDKMLSFMCISDCCTSQLHARLLRALASSDPSQPGLVAQGLPSLAAEMRGIDVDALEEATLLSTRRAGVCVAVEECLRDMKRETRNDQQAAQTRD